MKNLFLLLSKFGQKLLKGLILLSVIGIISSITIGFFQSCSKDSYYETDLKINRTAELNNFKKSMQKADIIIKNKISRLKSAELDFTNDQIANDFVAEVQPSALSLIKSYGISEEEIIAEFGSLDASKITLTAEGILEAERLIDDGKTLSIFVDEDYQLLTMSFLGINSLFADEGQKDTIGGCIADAIGITAAFEFIEQGVMGLGKKGVLKLIRKIGGKYLGAVGVALAAYDFADCMDWI